MLVNLALLIGIGLPLYQQMSAETPAIPTVAPALAAAPAQETPTATLPPPVSINTPLAEEATHLSDQPGTMILALRDGNYIHLFAYHPLEMPLTRLTDSNWDDMQPAVSPDGSRIAFASHRNGYWDIYIWNLVDNSQARITDTPEFDGSPSWSPDGQWLVYESYQDDSLEILVQSLADLGQPPIRLTQDPAADFSPTWSPQGREIAFVSTRSGEEEIWLARLDQVDNRFQNVSQNSQTRQNHPRWSGDGNFLAWTEESDDFSQIAIWGLQDAPGRVRIIESGQNPVWSPSGNAILALIPFANTSALSGYRLSDQIALFPPIQLPGQLYGMDWNAGQLTTLIAGLPRLENATLPAGALWSPVLSVNPMPPAGRFGIVPLDDVTAPYPYLHDEVNEAFVALRQEIANEIGWDFLDSLENAYSPLTEPPTESLEQDWLYTGRAFAFNPVPMQAGWMAIVKEVVNGQLYWRVYLKTRYQDGSQGMPLVATPWDINARYEGDPLGYEQGGRPGAVPSGYWVDFTEVAHRFGWERVPSLNTWRTFYPSIRFNQYILNDGLDWDSAMAEIYPPEALATATFQPTYTLTVSPTPEDPRLLTPSPTSAPTLTPTLHPTWTDTP
ncbi:MAG: hypothetical protein GYA17_16000 [Chloroflexi bacterium]|nr:hypothetical protein [Chloroflexota bacterium]